MLLPGEPAPLAAVPMERRRQLLPHGTALLADSPLSTSRLARPNLSPGSTQIAHLPARWAPLPPARRCRRPVPLPAAPP